MGNRFLLFVLIIALGGGLAACNDSDTPSTTSPAAGAAAAPVAAPTTMAENVGARIGAAVDRGIDRIKPDVQQAGQEAKTLALKAETKIDSEIHTTSTAPASDADSGRALIDKCNLDLAHGDLAAAQLDVQQLEALRPQLPAEQQAQVDDLKKQLDSKQRPPPAR